MANPSHPHFRPVRSTPVQTFQKSKSAASSAPVPEPESEPTIVEPPVRRWPHPIPTKEPDLSPEPTLHYIRCALSYQNQLLADIKALLQRLVPEDSEK